MAINKVEYNGNTLIDLTNMTAIASDVASGKTFYGKDGVLTTGTASGGGSVVVETGTYTPSADIARPAISFSGTHTTCPSFLTIYDCTEENYPDTNCNVAMTWINVNRLFNGKYMYNSNTSAYRYITIQYLYRGTTLTSVSSGTQHIGYPDTDTHTNSSSYPRYWVSPTDFHPYTSSTTRYWRKDRNYKWIAIWT